MRSCLARLWEQKRLKLCLSTSNTHFPYFVLQCSKICLPPWFLCNMRMEWLAALWPWCQTGGRGTASGGPGCTSGAPHNTCAHPSSRGALLIKKNTQHSGHSQGWMFIQYTIYSRSIQVKKGVLILNKLQEVTREVIQMIIVFTSAHYLETITHYFQWHIT